jgi:choline dehydrogenase-like flavoprotein
MNESRKKAQGAVNLNTRGTEQNTYDAIVIGSGISGGWAAKELCEKGLKTLVLERGRNVEHVKDYPTANTPIWEFPHRLVKTNEFVKENPVISKCYAVNESTEHFFVKDKEHPYVQIRPFDWIRGYQVGGKSLTWGRWTQRWSEIDFEANLKEGIAVDWPIRYKDLAPWYSYVERFAGISGNRDNLPQLPDGEFLKPMEMNSVEKHFKEKIEQNFPGRNLIISRTANLSEPINGRGPCQYRDLCSRGCPFSGYFSSNSATLPAAQKTGNMTLHPHAVVHSIIYDDQKQKAVGVRVINALTHEVTEYFAKIIFVNAGTLNTALLMLNSTSSRFPNGLGNDSGELGHNLMDHNYNARVHGEYEGFEDQYYSGRRPTGTYLPRFRNFGNDKRTDYLRGFAYAVLSKRQGWGREVSDAPLGADLKSQLTEPGLWNTTMVGMGECLPDYNNKVSLSKTKKDAWGIPLLEMGTARMGRDPKTSVLNGNNQVWGAENVFVTDGACMTSSACQNPSLTYMAITARAADYAVNELKKQNI